MSVSVFGKPLFGVCLGVRGDLLFPIGGFRAAVRIQEVVPLGRHVHRHFVTGGIAERAVSDLLHDGRRLGVVGLGLRRLNHCRNSPLIRFINIVPLKEIFVNGSENY